MAPNVNDPFAILGMHADPANGKIVVRAFLPHAKRAWVIDVKSKRSAGELVRVDPSGFFAVALRRAEPFAYRFKLETESGIEEVEDPYRFGAVLGELDAYLIAEGSHRRLWEKLGAHPGQIDGVAGTAFAVWAPNARRVAVVGDFNEWDGRRHPMRFRGEAGVWEIFMPGVGPGALYKFEIHGPDGNMLPLKADPFGFASEHPPATASRVIAPSAYQWNDAAWLERRGDAQVRDAAISTYEVHLGSWKRADGNRYLTYRELADDLVSYAVYMGFTHLELMPVSEFPFDGSWGYQPIGLFAPTCRFGEPDDFRYFIDRAHQAGISVILDWVPGHFPTDTHGLGMFDGTHLYEHADPRQGFQPDWNTYIYNFGRREVANFLLSNALFWLREYHIDGLRVDAVASMLYLDYSRKSGEWVPNEFGGNENLAATAFLRHVNELAFSEVTGATTIAEESTSWPMVSQPTFAGGLGFGFKWNMGWMHDTLAYMSEDPINRSHHQDQLTFGLLYAFSENFVLPLSHDEVVHGKKSLLEKMPGDAWQKFANLRAYYGFLYAHPGKKLLFMGNEFAQIREWNHDRSLDWHVTQSPSHAGIQTLVRDLNHLYRGTPALYECDAEPAGFEWIDASDHNASVLSFIRRGRSRELFTVTVCNFTPVVREGYRIGVPSLGRYQEILNTDASRYGGSGVGNGEWIDAESIPLHGRPYSIVLTLAPLATMMYATT